MEFKFLNTNDENITLEQNESNKYKKILNNLLSINTRSDNAIFTKPNPCVIDLTQNLSELDVEKVFNSPEFKVKIQKYNYKKLIEDIQKLNDFIEIRKKLIESTVISQAQIKRWTNDFNLINDLIDIKCKIIEKLNQDNLNFLNKYKQIVKKINDLYNDTNVWSFYVASYFIQQQAGSKTIYAPLILKEVEINISNNEVFLTSRNASCIVNEKVSFLLKQFLNINIPLIKENCEKCSISDVSYELNEYLKQIIKLEPGIELYKFNIISKKTDIDSIQMIKCPGLVTINANPQGGVLRNALLKLIKDNKVSEWEKNIPKYEFQSEEEKLKKFILANNEIYRITETDFSQEKAIVSSLNGSTIIIGPPGTGKSQTIANILLNIILMNKKALFLSEKKVALDVVLKRLKDLELFTLPILDKNMTNKKEFYYKFNKFISILNNINSELLPNKNKLISNEQIKYQKLKQSLKKYDENILNLFDLLIKKDFLFNKETFLFFIKYDFMALKNFFIMKSVIHDLNRYNNEISNILVSILMINESKDEEFSLDIKRLFNLECSDIKDFKKTLGFPCKKIIFIKKYPKYTELIWDLFQEIQKIKNHWNTNSNNFDKFLEILNSKELSYWKLLINLEKDYTKFLFKFNEEDICDLYDKLSNLDETLIEKIIDLYDIYKNHDNFVPKTNKFNDEFHSLLNKAKEIMIKNIRNSEEVFQEQWWRKFVSQVNSSSVMPNNLINKYQKFLKNIFNIFVGTPDSLSRFIDFNSDKYDYVIFDEASQIFVEKGLPYFSIAKNIIVAGDTQQMPPSNWFAGRFDSDIDDDSEVELNEENTDSLLDYVIIKGLTKEQLELNYRSTNSNLISFSSKTFYNSNLKNLTNHGATRNSITVIDIEDSLWENNQNIKEAEIVIKLLEENIDKYKTIIILTLNKHQCTLIENLILNNFPSLYDEILNKNITIKNLENIQGDEADLVIISIGYTKEAKLASTYVCRPGGSKALNVAITRAKEKMIVVKSINSKEINVSNSNNDNVSIFKLWIQFLELSDDEQKKYSLIQSEYKNFDSNFEKDVYNWLISKEFPMKLEIATQYCVGSYSIDLALLDANTKKYVIGIEVDGYKYHSSYTQLTNDTIRQNFLESKGYKIFRIPELKWKLNKNSIFNKLSDILNRFNIEKLNN